MGGGRRPALAFLSTSWPTPSPSSNTRARNIVTTSKSLTQCEVEATPSMSGPSEILLFNAVSQTIGCHG